MTFASDHDALHFAASQPAALCTIVGIDGSFSRRCGAQLAVGRDGTLVGDMSDNCLHSELAAQAAAAAGDRTVRLLRYGRGSPFIDFRLPCGSGLDILIDPEPDRAALGHCLDDLRARQEAELGLPILPGTNADLLRTRAFIPAPRLILFGTGAECAALERLAAAQRVAVERREPGQGIALHQRPEGLSADPWTAIVLLFHDHEWEHALLEWALETDAFYIGAQGGAPARAERIARLRDAGRTEQQLSRIRSPIGLIPRTRDADVLGLSILADVIGAYEALHPHR